MKYRQPPATDATQVQWLEKLLLCIVLGLTVLRVTIVETPLIDSPQAGSVLSSENISLLLSTVLLACAAAWLLKAVISGQFNWRRTWFGWGVGLFIAAGVVAAVFASNKRAAVTDSAILASPMVAAMFLVQWLRSATRIRWTLLLILAVGVAATLQCYEQKTGSNDNVVAQYEANPAEFLQKQGIEEGTLEHWMYRHRLYSKDIRGFMMTSNSAATFFLLAVFAAAGLSLQTVSKKMAQQQLALFVCYLLAAGIILAGLLLTRSKGGLGAFVLGSMLLCVLLFFGKSIRKHRRIFGIVLLLLIVIAAGFMIHYGTTHGRLPGGNSMLVRWQYWVSSVEMIRDHFLAGVGGGNFPDYYMRYKIPAALETVQNPHNWIVSLLSQYGPLGLIAFIMAVIIVLFRGLQNSFSSDTNPTVQPLPSSGRLWIGLLACSALMMLIIRPMLVDLEIFKQQPDVAAAAYLVLYIIPAAIFVLVFILLRATFGSGSEQENDPRRLSCALMCGLAAVLIHNLVDFALFEPGNWTLFWLFAAIIIAQVHNSAEQPVRIHQLDFSKRLGLGAGLVIASIAYLSIVLLPALKAEQIFKKALIADTPPMDLIEAAIAADPLSSKTAHQAASLMVQMYQNQGMDNPAVLDRAEMYENIAIQRNDADFKLWRLRARINVIRSEQTEGTAKQAALTKAFEDLQQALDRYPGSDKLCFLLAGVAEQLGKNDVALSYYQAAVDIEDAYRVQFRIMYPNQDTIFSRLGEASYAQAQAKIEQLQK